MSEFPGGVRVTGFISPSDTTDTYPTHDSSFGKGGLHEVIDHDARDAIPAERRSEGMVVYTKNDSKYWSLQGGTSNDNWTPMIDSQAVDTIDGGYF